MRSRIQRSRHLEQKGGLIRGTGVFAKWTGELEERKSLLWRSGSSSYRLSTASNGPCCRSEEFPGSRQGLPQVPSVQVQGQVMGKQRTEAHTSSITAREERIASGALLPSRSPTNPPHGQNPAHRKNSGGEGIRGMWLLDFQSLRSRGKRGK